MTKIKCYECENAISEDANCVVAGIKSDPAQVEVFCSDDCLDRNDWRESTKCRNLWCREVTDYPGEECLSCEKLNYDKDA